MNFLRFLLFSLCLTACSSESVTVTPQAAALTGTVQLIEPPAGAVIYAEVMRISGTAEGVPAGGFVLVVSANDAEIARSRVLVSEGAWQIELLHGYRGDPVEASISAISPDPAVSEAYAHRLIALSSLAQRPAGAFARVTSNTHEGTLGGDLIRIEGMASGLAENRLMLRLLTPEEDLISESSITVTNPFIVDEMPWSADLSRGDYTGPATLELRDAAGAVLSSQAVTVESAAG
jgi:hypothetical protein